MRQKSPAERVIYAIELTILRERKARKRLNRLAGVSLRKLARENKEELKKKIDSVPLALLGDILDDLGIHDYDAPEGPETTRRLLTLYFTLMVQLEDIMEMSIARIFPADDDALVERFLKKIALKNIDLASALPCFTQFTGLGEEFIWGYLERESKKAPPH